LNMPANLWLDFSLDDGGDTRLRVARQEIPWRVVRGFPNAGGETLAHLNNISGGILDTDDLELRIAVQASARAQITSTGATRIYRSRSPERQAHSHVEVDVAAGGFLEYLPDALIPYGGSRYRQTTRIRLDGGASLIWWEIVSPGREASGEVFRYQRLASRMEIFSDGKPLWEEIWDLAPALEPLDSAARLGPFRHFASLYLCQSGAARLEPEMARLAEEHSVPNELLWGAGSLRSDGLVLRGVAKSGRHLTRSLTAIWEAAKLSLCGRVATPPRKIY
jgi:urease accessory protein